MILGLSPRNSTLNRATDPILASHLAAADVVFIEGQDMSVEDAERFAQAILAAVSEARS